MCSHSHVFVKCTEIISTAVRAGASYTLASPPSYFLLCLVVWEWMGYFEDLGQGKLIRKYIYWDLGEIRHVACSHFCVESCCC